MNELLKNKKIMLGIVIFGIIAITAICLAFLNQREKMPASNIEDVRQASTAPSREIEIIEQQLCSFLTARFDQCPEDAKMRDKSYSEYTDSGVTNALFLVDIDSIQQTYKVYFSWPAYGGETLSDSIFIECPSPEETKYPDSKCIEMYE